MAFDLSAASNVLKTRYLGPIREQLNNSTILLSRIGREDNAISVSGKNFTVPLHTGRNTSAGTGRVDGGTLPTAGAQSYDVAVVPNTYQYGRIQITGPTVAATRDNAGAFVKAIDAEIQGLVMDFKRSFNRQLHSDGVDALGYIAATVTATTAGVVDDRRGNNANFLQSGAQVVDILAGNTTTVRSAGVTVTPGSAATSPVGQNVTFGVAQTLVTLDPLVVPGTAGLQLMGIAGIVSASDPPLLGGGLHGLPVASKTFWIAQVVNNSGTNQSLTLENMQKPLDLIATNSDYDEGGVKFLLCSYGVRAKYVSILIADKRHVNTMELDGGFSAVDFNGKPLVPDPQCRKNRIYYLSPDTLKIFRTSDFDWLDKDGSVLSRVPNTDAYEATMFHYGNLGTIARNANGLLDDISE